MGNRRNVPQFYDTAMGIAFICAVSPKYFWKFRWCREGANPHDPKVDGF